MKRPDVLPHEETLVSWWRLGNTLDNFDLWMNLSERCHGASLAMMDIRGAGAARASLDYAVASALATHRAIATGVTPPPAPMSQLEAAA